MAQASFAAKTGALGAEESGLMPYLSVFGVSVPLGQETLFAFSNPGICEDYQPVQVPQHSAGASVREGVAASFLPARGHLHFPRMEFAKLTSAVLQLTI